MGRNFCVHFGKQEKEKKGMRKKKKKECGINLENGLSKERDWQGKRWAF